MAQMQGSMRAMNSSLSTAADTVEKQMGDVRHLEGLWELEHQRYQVALEQRKSAETKFEKATREFREEVAAMKKELDDAEKAHAEQLRSSRAEVQGMLVEAQNTFEAGLASLESALAVSKCDVSRLERELQEARADSSKSILEEREITMKALNITSSDLHEDMDVMKQAAAEAEKAHAEQVRSARTELQRVLSDTQENFKREVNRLEAALKVGNGDVERLELELHEASDMLKEAKLEITRFGKELTDSRAEAALFQQKLASSEAALAQHKMQIESLMTGRLIKFQLDSGIPSERPLESAAPTKGVAANSQGPFKLKVTVVKSLQYLHAQKSTLSKLK
jgi:chromosome segregation ATPase